MHGSVISERLIAEGLGVAIAVPPNTRLAECLFAVEQRARAERVGLWRGKLQAAANVGRSGFALLEGVVTKIDHRRTTAWLEVDDHLVIKVDKGLLSMPAELDQLLGKRVEIRGWVVDRGNISQSGRKRWFISLSDRRHFRILKK